MVLRLTQNNKNFYIYLYIFVTVNTAPQLFHVCFTCYHSNPKSVSPASPETDLTPEILEYWFSPHAINVGLDFGENQHFQ